jgi:RNA polymerase sigma factor (sigma-70 family)
LQETLLAAYRKRDNLRNLGSFKSWLFQIAANQIREFYRRHAHIDILALDELLESELVQTRHGFDVRDAVTDTLGVMKQEDAELLKMVYFLKLPQQSIAAKLAVPVGTVKSRLHTAKERFRAAYPFPPRTAPLSASKGAKVMKVLPEKIPDYRIEKSEKQPFSVVWEELMGWFIIPRLGESLPWAMYQCPDGKQVESYHLSVTGKAMIHGVEGVEIVAEENSSEQHKSTPSSQTLIRIFVAQLTDTHCRFLAESHTSEGVKRVTTFFDNDQFMQNWGYGEDNCGNETHLTAKGLVKREGDVITTSGDKEVLDIVGRYTVTIAGKSYDTICVMDIGSYENGVVSEQYLDQHGRTVLWRRFNPNDWHIERYGDTLWSERLPNSERITVNGKTFVHWYDCITDYIL